VNQDLVAGLNLSLVAQTLQRGECRNRHSCRLLKRHPIRLQDQCLLWRTRVLGKSTVAMSPDSGPRILRVAETQAEHLLAWFEPGYVPAHRFNLAGHVPAGPCVLWFAQPQQHAKAVRPGFHQGPVKWIDGSRVNLDQDFVVLGSGRFDLRDVNDIRRSVSGIDGGSHARSPALLGMTVATIPSGKGAPLRALRRVVSAVRDFIRILSRWAASLPDFHGSFGGPSATTAEQTAERFVPAEN